MNEGKALVGKMCRYRNFGGDWRELISQCREYCGSLYQDVRGAWWSEAEAVEVKPVVVEELTDEMIFSHWWRIGNMWFPVLGYDSEAIPRYLVKDTWVKRRWFDGREHGEAPWSEE